MANTRQPNSDWMYFRRLLIGAAVAVAVYIAWKVSGIFMLLFAAVLLAVLLRGLADLLSHRASVPQQWSFAIALIGLVLVTVALLALFGTQVASQVAEVFRQAPEALNAAGEQFGITNASQRLADALSSGESGQFLSQAASYGYTIVGIAADLLVVIVAAIYLAADPTLYRRGVARLFSPELQERVLDTMSVAATALRLWFVGQSISMIFVGTLAGFAFWLIGLPSPIGLGIVAGVTNFIPFVGPLIGAIPAILLAFVQEPMAVVWTAGAVLVIQQIEGNVIMPLVQRQTVDMPPAVALFSILVFGALFGLLGVMFATPLAVVMIVLLEKLWIRETLGQKAKVPGES